MTNRREFIQGCIAASAVPAATVLPRGSTRARPTGPTFYRTIYDQRFADSVAFGAEAEKLGETTRAISGDITQLWFREIDLKWRTSPVAIAGLTASGPLFCLERWGWDAGLRVVYRAEHQSCRGRVQHKFFGPRQVLAAAQSRLSGPDWAAQMAQLAVTCPHDICPPSEASIAGHKGAIATEVEGALISWVIAPVKQA